jgi:hypothetical protein
MSEKKALEKKAKLSKAELNAAIEAGGGRAAYVAKVRLERAKARQSEAKAEKAKP